MYDSAVTTIENKVLAKTFFWMFLGLLSSAVVAWYVYASGYISNIISNQNIFLIYLAELVIVIAFNASFQRCTATTVSIFYFIYAMLNGLTFSLLFAMFELDSIINVFFACAGFFAVLAYIGYKTEKDLTNWSTFLFPVLLMALIISVVNIFLGNAFIDTIIDWVVLISVSAITIYDMNKLGMLQKSGVTDSDKIHIYFAMQLYLDFINIFIRILFLFGKRKD
jgi:hypothetical protein